MKYLFILLFSLLTFPLFTQTVVPEVNVVSKHGTQTEKYTTAFYYTKNSIGIGDKVFTRKKPSFRKFTYENEVYELQEYQKGFSLIHENTSITVEKYKYPSSKYRVARIKRIKRIGGWAAAALTVGIAAIVTLK